MGEVLVPEDPPESGSTKQTYEPPKLFGYGTLRDITLATAFFGRADHGHGKKEFTHIT
jgi:hypothetical protein